MAITLTVKNVEEIVFSNNKIMSSLPKYKPLFETWLFASRVPSLKSLRYKTVVEFLKLLTKSELLLLEQLVKKELLLDNSIYESCKNCEGEIENIEFNLPTNFNTSDFCIYRKGNQVGVTLWN